MSEHDDNATSLREGESGAIRWETIRQRLEAVRQKLEHGTMPTAEQRQAILKARAKLLAQEPDSTTDQAAAMEIITFRMAHETYGVESHFIREVYPLRDYCPLPCTPAFVFGLVNVRGQLISVLDLKRFFGLATQEIDNHSQVIILHHGAMEVGILADALLEVRHVRPESLQSSLPTLRGLRQEFLFGITPDRVIILDAKKLLSSKEIIVYEEVET
jgi:purine-binding chemotaxis protein CheW